LRTDASDEGRALTETRLQCLGERAGELAQGMAGRIGELKDKAKES
jgi:hypothetical protein